MKLCRNPLTSKWQEDFLLMRLRFKRFTDILPRRLRQLDDTLSVADDLVIESKFDQHSKTALRPLARFRHPLTLVG